MRGSRQIFRFTDVVPWRTLSAALITASFFLIPAVSIANTVFAGNIKLVEGVTPAEYVKIVRPGFTQILAGKPGDALFEGDTVKTGEGVKTQLELSDQTLITLAPNSILQIKGYMTEPMAARRSSVMKVPRGTVRFIVAKLFKPNGSGERRWMDSSVTIETMNAVAGVRGTDLFVSMEGDDSEIAVLEGVVAVESLVAGEYAEVFLGANQLSRTKTGGAPGAAADLAAERRDALIKLGTLEAPLSSVDKPNKRKPRYDAAGIQRDLAVELPLHLIIDRAVESGMTIEEVVAAALAIGIDPGAVIYTGIQEGYQSSSIVETAIESGTPIMCVFSAAVSAGATQSAVIAGAQNAGVPSVDIAGALVGIASVDTTELCATTTAPTGVSAGIPPALPLAGGWITGGGGTPSASPYKP